MVEIFTVQTLNLTFFCVETWSVKLRPRLLEIYRPRAPESYYPTITSCHASCRLLVPLQRKDFPSNSFYVVVVVKTEDEACGGPLRFYPLRPDELIDAGNRSKILDVVVSPAINCKSRETQVCFFITLTATQTFIPSVIRLMNAVLFIYSSILSCLFFLFLVGIFIMYKTSLLYRVSLAAESRVVALLVFNASSSWLHSAGVCDGHALLSGHLLLLLPAHLLGGLRGEQAVRLHSLTGSSASTSYALLIDACSIKVAAYIDAKRLLLCVPRWGVGHS